MNKKGTVCIDLDGTLAKYEGWQGKYHIGEPISGAKEFVEKVAKLAKIIIYTCRLNYEFNDLDTNAKREEIKGYIETWLKKHEIPFDEIFCGQGKPVAEAYIDDRGVRCDPQNAHNPQSRYNVAFKQLERLL